MAVEIVQFVPFSSFVNPSFWHKLADVKIDIDRLDDGPRPIFGFYSCTESLKCSMEVEYTAFNSEFSAPHNCFKASGTIYNKNTIEDFRECNKQDAMQDEGKRLTELIRSGDWIQDPSQLVRFLIISFADLKKFNFYYCFGYPAPLYENSHIVNEENPLNTQALIQSVEDQSLDLTLCIFSWNADSSQFTYRPLSEFINPTNPNGNFQDVDLTTIFFGFADPSSNDKPGWPLRVFIAALLHSCPRMLGQVINVISLKNSRRLKLSASKLLRIRLPESFSLDATQWLGWELNAKGKFAPKLAAMGESMDPAKLAESSTNLNLKLMKWRLMPNLNLSAIADQKCLLFGAGTLGCGVARNLLSWGVRHITFVDSGRVSYSNPVRQNLFRHEDAVNNRPKAETAAQRILEICPGATVQGHSIHIPMPGHNVDDSMRSECVEQFQKIDDLVKQHDVLFLLTDSRESRWLPTVMGAAHGKIVMNSALGFDSYLVMRHGRKGGAEKSAGDAQVDGLKCVPGHQLGCYFCNDIVAPGNSLKDRTLDQQCTVTRPAVSNIASALVVELLVALTQHDQRSNAPAYIKNIRVDSADVPEGILGVIPHSIRGSLSTFEQILPATERFTKCIACSEIVLDSFQRDGFEFALQVFNSSNYLEDLTGITALLHAQQDIVECDEDDFDLSD